MTRRSKDQLERDRADLVEVLREGGPLETHAVLARALGYARWDLLLQAYTPGLWLEYLSDDVEERDYVDGWREALSHLRGRDLVCWCPLDQPCHADVLLEVANR